MNTKNENDNNKNKVQKLTLWNPNQYKLNTN
jgi:hypothetical protein